MIELDLRTLLLAAPAVAAIVGDRVYDDEAPPKTPAPYIVFNTVFGRRENTLVNGASPLRNARIQIDCYARTKLLAEALGDKVVRSVVDAKIFSATTNEDQLLKDPETKLGRMVLDFSIWQNSPVN